MTVKTLWTLPPQPLPETGLVGPVFITIWLFSCLILVYGFYRLLYRNKPTWPEFRLIFIGVALLAFWYLFSTIDRWIHYDQRVVRFGYILLAPIWEFSRISSTIFLLWGTYTVVWNELEGRFKEAHQGYWWFAAKCAIFLVCLMSIFYLVLFLALAIVWMEFFSLNTIADIATKRTNFEIAMTAFFVGFGLLTLTAATATIFFRARQVDGRVRASRVVLWLATLVLLIRSIVEFALALRAYGPDATRRSLALASDVSFGLISCIYLLLMGLVAMRVASSHDSGSRDHRRVEAKIRGWILTKLNHDTSGARQQSPPFSQLLQDLRSRVDILLDDGTLSGGSSMTKQENVRVIEDYIQRLDAEFGPMNPKGEKYYDSRPGSRVHSVLVRKPIGGGRRHGGPSSFASDPNMRRSNRAVSSPLPPEAGRSSAPAATMSGYRNVTTPGRMEGYFTHDPSGSRVSGGHYRSNMSTHTEYPEQYEMRSVAESSNYTTYP